MPRLRFGNSSQTWNIEHDNIGLSALPTPQNRNTTDFTKFKLLVWKNWTIQKRHRWHIFFEIFLPVFCAAILIITRHFVPAEFISTPTEFQSFYVDTAPVDTVQDFCNEIYYAPKNPATDSLMNTVRDNYFKFMNGKEYKVTGFETEEKLYEAYNLLSLQLHNINAIGGNTTETSLEDPKIPVLAGVVFTNSFDDDNDTFPSQIEYKLRFPGTQRSEFDLLTERFGLKPAWYTDLIYPFVKLPGPRARLSANGGLPGYYAEGFLYLQQAIETTLLKSFLTDKEELSRFKDYEIKLRRFPYPPYTEDKFLFSMEGSLPIIIMLSLVYPILNITRCIVIEKEKKLKESMKMMGLPNYLHWTSWFIRAFTFLIVAIFLMTILLTTKLGSDHAVINTTNPALLFCLILAFAIQSVSIAFIVTSLTNTANVAAVVATVVWVVFFVPFTFIQPRYYLLSRTTKILSSLFTNVPIGYICFFLCAFETRGTGLQWEYLTTGIGPGDDFSVLDCLLGILFNSVFYFLLALYIESVWPGEYGIPLPWYYPFTKWYWTNGSQKVKNPHLEANATSSTPPHLLEAEPENDYAGVKIKGLSKQFGDKVAVKNIHLNMYENQITVLLGHNGAGKSTTISMLTGLFPPSSGTALLQDFDISYEMNSVRSSLGICPQHDVLFDDLTVEEHLQFYCVLKGMPNDAVKYEVDRILKVLGLEDKRTSQAKTLSGGMKRKLSVSVAFCAGSKVVLLDEPTSGMDPSARRSCWDLIQNFKRGRTVLLSTHFMEEADLLGDRIAILAGGELQCCGSSLFLKKKYGGGYHLTIVKDEDCIVENVTNVLKERISEVEIDQNVGAELTYSLPDEKSSLFPEMFEELETRKTELGIASYGASITTMEEVFIRVGREAEKKHAEEFQRMHSAPSSKSSTISNGNSNHIGVSLGSLVDANSNTNLHEQSRRNTGMSLFLQQFRAMVVKKLIYIFRNRILLISQLGLPVFVLCTLLAVAPSFPALNSAPPLTMDMKVYQEFGQIITPVHCEFPSPICEAFKDTTVSEGYTLEDSGNESLANYIVGKQLIDLTYVNYRYIIGYEEESSNDSSTIQITSYFNNEQLHTPALAYNLITNAILKSFDKNITMKVTNHPLSYTQLETGQQTSELYSLGFLVGYNLTFGMSFLAASFVIFLITERESRSKHLQYISGVKFYTFWLANYFVDFICFMLPCILIQIALHLFQVAEYTSYEVTVNMFILFVVFGASILPFMYIFSFAFTEPTNGFIRTAMFNIFTGKISMVVFAIITIAEFKLENVGDSLNDAFMMFPLYAFGNGLVQMAKNVLLKGHCDFFFDSPESLEFGCLLVPNNLCCTTIKENFFDWEVNGIGKNICSLVVLGVGSIIILILMELRVWKLCQRSRKTAHKSGNAGLDDLIQEDQDVAEERKRIQSTPIKKLNETENIILRDLTKYYGKFLAVDKLNLGIQRGQTFGLLGVNGAGKTTTFKMLTGDYSCTAGDAIIYSHSIRNDLNGAHRNMGYCPQFDGLIGEMTGRETLRMIGRLRGIWEQDIEPMINKIGNDLIFTEYLDKLVRNYSGGNKRKLSTAMAFVGNPPIVFLDEPSTGMDPVARRHLWNAITIVREAGTSVVLTSHSLEECEILCSRLAIMVNGVFRCLGSPQHLKNKFGEGYTIIAQCPPKGVGEEDHTREKQETGLKRSSSLILRKTTAPQKWEQALDNLRNFIEESFPGALLKDIHPGFIHYHIKPSPDITWGKLFQKMEIAKEKFKLDAYSVGQTSLEQVFLNFAKSQNNIG